MIDKDKVIQLAKDAGMTSDEAGAFRSDLMRFYAAAYRQGLEDAANECERIAREEYSMNGLYEYGECATAIRSLKESTNG